MFDWFRKKRPDFDDQWMDIQTFRIGEEKDYLVTDGKNVRSQWSPTYNEYGENIFHASGKEAIVTHWMRYPKPPRRK